MPPAVMAISPVQGFFVAQHLGSLAGVETMLLCLLPTCTLVLLVMFAGSSPTVWQSPHSVQQGRGAKQRKGALRGTVTSSQMRTRATTLWCLGKSSTSTGRSIGTRPNRLICGFLLTTVHMPILGVCVFANMRSQVKLSRSWLVGLLCKSFLVMYRVT